MEEKFEEIIYTIAEDSSTALDFAEGFKLKYPSDWIDRSVTTYLSNRLDVYSQKPDSLLKPFTRYKQAEFKDCRRTKPEERKVFGSPWTAVFKKRKWHAGHNVMKRSDDS